MRIAALDIGGTTIKYAKVSGADCALSGSGEETTPAGQGGAAVVARAAALLKELRPFDRIGVATAGQVCPETGKIIYATDNIPAYTGMPLKQLLERQFEVPVAVDNDVNAAALCEAKMGAGKGSSHLLCVTYGTGVGGALILNGQVYRGAAGSAGEVGHIVTHAGGNPCTCGGRGCYETYASTRALCILVAQKTGEQLNGREIFARLQQPDIQACVDAWIREIFYGLQSLVYALNPQCIVLGGGIMQENYIIHALRTLLPSGLMPSVRDIEVRAAQMGNWAGILGAALQAAEL